MMQPDINKRTLLDLLADAERMGQQIPNIDELCSVLGVSRSSLREQLEVARQLGFVTIKPRTGIKKNKFSIKPALMLSLNYGIKFQPELFDHYADLRKHLESVYWFEAVSVLGKSDLQRLQQHIDRANGRINSRPTQVPVSEHRQFHLAIYSRLQNPLVKSLLEAYWDLYEKSDLKYFMDQSYLISVWNYHQQMLDAVKAREFEVGYQALLTHMDLVKEVKKAELKQRFE